MPDKKPPYNTSGPRAEEASVDEAAMNAMMKARLAYEYERGNPAAKRMVAPVDNPYDFGDGRTGTHYMSSYDNYAIPEIQDVDGTLEMTGPRDNEAIRFDREEDARYFANENYKRVSPMFIENEKQKFIKKFMSNYNPQQMYQYGGALAPIIPTYYKSKGTPIYRDTTSLPFEEGGKLNDPSNKKDILNTYKNIPGVNVNKLNQYLDLNVNQPQTTKQAMLLAEAVGYSPEQAKVVGAQWAIESARGASQAGNYNYFGIKSHNQNVMDRMSKKYGIDVSESNAKSTKEVIDGKTITIQDKFANFNNPIEGFLGHKAFLETNKRYKDALNPELNANQFAQGLQKAGYATDPTYAVKLKGIYAGKLRDTRPSWMKPTKNIEDFKMSSVQPTQDSRKNLIEQEINLPEVAVETLGNKIEPLEIQPIDIKSDLSRTTVQEGSFYNDPRTESKIKQDTKVDEFMNKALKKEAEKGYFGSGQSMFYPSSNAYGGKIYKGGGYTVTRSNDRKGKTHKVTRKSDGKTEYYGHAMKNQPNNPKVKKAAEARHRAQGNFKNPFFKAYWDATWKYGGNMDKKYFQNGGPGEPDKQIIPSPRTQEEYETHPAILKNRALKAQYEQQLADFSQAQKLAQQEESSYEALQQEYLKNKTIYDAQIKDSGIYTTKFQVPGVSGGLDVDFKDPSLYSEISDPNLIAEFNRRKAAELARANTGETYVPVSKVYRPSGVSDAEFLRGKGQGRYGTLYAAPKMPQEPTTPSPFSMTAPSEPEYMQAPSRPLEVETMKITPITPIESRGPMEIQGAPETRDVYKMTRTIGKGPKGFPKIYKSFEEAGQQQYVTPGQTYSSIRPKNIVPTSVPQQYPMYPVGLKTGGSINLDPAKKGTFKAQATRMGLSVQDAASKILNAPEGTYSAAMRRKANFAKNFAK